MLIFGKTVSAFRSGPSLNESKRKKKAYSEKKKVTTRGASTGNRGQEPRRVLQLLARASRRLRLSASASAPPGV
jgi:hypothetical protein